MEENKIVKSIEFGKRKRKAKKKGPLNNIASQDFSGMIIIPDNESCNVDLGPYFIVV